MAAFVATGVGLFLTAAPLVNRSFPKNGRAALSPDGLHYASFEANELRIYTLGISSKP
jgi:hypothetical protein